MVKETWEIKWETDFNLSQREIPQLLIENKNVDIQKFSSFKNLKCL